MSDYEVKEAVEELGQAWHEFKRTNDERLRQIEQRGHASADLEAKVNRIGKDLDTLAVKLNRSPYGEYSEAKEPVPGGYVDRYAGREYSEKYGLFLRKGEVAGLAELETKALSEGSDPDGGYLVTEEMSGVIARKIFETSPIRQVATVQPVGTKALEILQDFDDIDAGWVAETDTRAATTNPKWRKKEVNVHELYAMPAATQTILDDATIDVQQWLSGKIASKFSRMENTAFVSGDGVGKPRGFLTYDAGTDITKQQIEQVNSGDANLLTADGLISLTGALKYGYRGNAVWLMSRNTIADVRKLKDPVTGLYLWQPALQLGQPDQLLGYPLYPAADMPDVAANALSVVFGDFKQAYTIVDRVGIRILRDPFSSKPNVLFYTTKRVGGDVVNYEAIKLQKIAA